MFHVPNQYRERNHPRLKSTDDLGNNGFFTIPHWRINGYQFLVQASVGLGWEHVSVSVQKKGQEQTRCPTWGEMCWVKNLFWDEEDCVAQFHPSKSEYVNLHEFVLHLWRPTHEKMPIPIKIMVG